MLWRHTIVSNISKSANALDCIQGTQSRFQSLGLDAKKIEDKWNICLHCCVAKVAPILIKLTFLESSLVLSNSDSELSAVEMMGGMDWTKSRRTTIPVLCDRVC